MEQTPEQHNPYSSHYDEDEIDLMELVKKIWKGRRFIILSTVLFAAIGLFVALGSAEEYTSQVKMVPEGQAESGIQLGGLARQFGIGMGAGSGGEGILPNLYPDVTNSLPLMQLLMDYEVQIERLDTTATLFTYLTELNPPSSVSVVKKYSIGLPFTLLGWTSGLFSEDTPEPPHTLLDDPAATRQIMRMSDEQWKVVNTLRGRISTSYNERGGTINISVEMPDPEVAADVAQQVVLFLTDYITTYRTDKARDNLEFIEGRHEDAKQRFETAQRRLAEFTDRHRGTMTAVAEIESQRLQSDYNMAFNIYNSMAERLEQSRISLQEETPVVKVIEPAAVPHQRSSPKRGLIMIVFVMLGGMAGIGYVFGVEFYENVKESFKEEPE